MNEERSRAVSLAQPVDLEVDLAEPVESVFVLGQGALAGGRGVVPIVAADVLLPVDLDRLEVVRTGHDAPRGGVVPRIVVLVRVAEGLHGEDLPVLDLELAGHVVGADHVHGQLLVRVPIVLAVRLAVKADLPLVGVAPGCVHRDHDVDDGATVRAVLAVAVVRVDVAVAVVVDVVVDFVCVGVDLVVGVVAVVVVRHVVGGFVTLFVHVALVAVAEAVAVVVEAELAGLAVGLVLVLLVLVGSADAADQVVVGVVVDPAGAGRGTRGRRGGDVDDVLHVVHFEPGDVGDVPVLHEPELLVHDAGAVQEELVPLFEVDVADQDPAVTDLHDVRREDETIEIGGDPELPVAVEIVVHVGAERDLEGHLAAGRVVGLVVGVVLVRVAADRVDVVVVRHDPVAGAHALVVGVATDALHRGDAASGERHEGQGEQDAAEHGASKAGWPEWPKSQ